MDSDRTPIPTSFAQLGLSEPLTLMVNELGYETPTPIQQQTIPLLLDGHDLIGLAQTGTGKTAAFALPILDRLDLSSNVTQALVLAPTRELAIQTSEAIHSYSKHLGRIRTMPVYGGESIQKQINRLRGGIHVIVGTPGRIIDHLKRGSLDFSEVKMVVLDEADEMLRMGFLDDVDWILGHAPADRQTALFSATMPKEVRRVADRHLHNPVAVEIKHKTLTLPSIEQIYYNVPEKQKLNTLTHLLETEITPGEATIIFARTKHGAANLAEKLQARGYEAEAMHGGMSQNQRENTIRRMRAGLVQIVVATDVAARGLDVEHITYVINYDIPNDPESYVHRIGRTGRAGRAGTAILFVAPREGTMMREIENYTGQRLTSKKLPSVADVAARRMSLFKEKLVKALDDESPAYLQLVEELAVETGRDMAEIAAVAARLAHGDKTPVAEKESAEKNEDDADMVHVVIGAGRRIGVRPNDVVGAIANEARIPGKVIGAIDIQDHCTFVEVPAEYERQVLAGLSGLTIRGREIGVRLATEQDLWSRGPKRRNDDGRRGAAPRGHAAKRKKYGRS